MDFQDNFHQFFSSVGNLLSKPQKFSSEYKKLSPEFNAFSVLDPLETQISSMIAELLNPQGNHAQGAIFLNFFIKHFIKEARDLGLPLDFEKASVHKEFKIIADSDEEGRIDIFIDFDNIFSLAIENKPFAQDGFRGCIGG